MAAMQALSKPFVGLKIECRSARQTQRVRTSLVVSASQEEQAVVYYCSRLAAAEPPSSAIYFSCGRLRFFDSV